MKIYPKGVNTLHYLKYIFFDISHVKVKKKLDAPPYEKQSFRDRNLYFLACCWCKVFYSQGGYGVLRHNSGYPSLTAVRAEFQLFLSFTLNDILTIMRNLFYIPIEVIPKQAATNFSCLHILAYDILNLQITLYKWLIILTHFWSAHTPC